MFVEQNEFRGWSMLTINYARTLDVLLMANAAFFFYLSSSRCVCVCVSIILLYLFNYLLDDWSFCGSFPLIVLMRIPHVLNVRSQKKIRNKTEFKEKNQRHFGEQLFHSHSKMIICLKRFFLLRSVRARSRQRFLCNFQQPRIAIWKNREHYGIVRINCQTRHNTYMHTGIR